MLGALAKGRGVYQFIECPTANKWLSTKFGFSTSEWINAIKITGNVLPVKTNPRYNHKHCDEFETLGQIFGKCPRGELLRNNRHRSIRSLLASKLNNRIKVQRQGHRAPGTLTKHFVKFLQDFKIL